MNQLVPNGIEPVYMRDVPESAVRSKLLELLGVEETPECDDFVMEPAEETRDGLLVSRVTYPNSLGETVPAILSLPAGAPAASLAGVVCLPGSTGGAERVAHPHFYREYPCSGPLVGWGRELARRGFATLSISLKGCEGRRGPVNPILQSKLLAPYGRTQMGVAVDEALRGARILAASLSRSPARIGLAGMSLGGNVTWYAMACAPWISTAVPVCGGLGSMAAFIHEGDAERHGPYYFIPHMLRYFDHPKVVATCITPRPFMMIAPTMDEDMPRSGVETLIQAVEPAFRSVEHPERFKVYQPETNHLFLIEFFEWMVAWFRQFLSAKTG